MAVIEFSNPIRNRATSRAPLGGDWGAPAYNPTHNALRRIISPVPQSGLFSSGAYLRGLPTLGRSAGTQAGGGPNLVPGPLGIWQEDRNRPREQTGKFGVNLMGEGQGWAPGAPSPYTPGAPPDRAEQLRALAAPDNPDNKGFFEGMFGAIGGVLGDAGEQVGSFLGSGVDLPFETAGNILGLPLGLATSIGQHTDNIDADLLQVYEEASKDNPIQGLLLWSHLAKAQWQRDADAGRHTGLFSDLGPATALTDQAGLLLNAIFGSGMKALQRGALGATGAAEQSIRTVEQAVARGETVTQRDDGTFESSDERIQANVYANLQMRLERGDFGRPGSQEARDRMLDQIVVEGGVLRDVSDVPQVAGEGGNQALPFGMTFQGLADMAFSLATDPLILASGGVAALGKFAKAGTMAANAKFWTAVPPPLRTRVAEVVEETAMRVGKFDSAERAWAALGRASRSFDDPARGARTADDIQFEQAVLREVIGNPEFASIRPQLEEALSYVDNWRTRWEPALRPVTETVRNLNDPFRLFGAGRANKAMGDVYSAHATEGHIRGVGSLDSHAGIQRELTAMPGDFVSAYNRGVAVASAFAARVYHRNSLMSDIRRRLSREDQTVHDMMQQYLPDEVVSARMNGSTAGDIASAMEKQAIRYRPAYVDQGGAEALARAQEEAATRLQLMGVGPDEARALAGKMNRDEVSLIDNAYFGYAMDQFVNARGAAKTAGVPKGLIDPDELTMLGPNQLTRQRAEDIIEAVNRGDIAEVRAALQRYDILFENLGSKLHDAKLMKAVRELLDDQLDALPRDIDSLDALPDALKDWAQRNGEFGYRPGFRPADDQMWRMTKDADGNILGVNPWIEVSSLASDVPTYTRFQIAKDQLFHAIRGERIMADARTRLGEFTTGRWGISRGDSDALFARFLKMAQESGITPRGMAPEQIHTIVRTHGLPPEIADRIGIRESIEALLYAFEGKFQHVGVTQKFTGSLKTNLGGQGNWIGRVAEAIYPVTRFTLNPVFQAQELTESFILNLMRGIRPGMRATEMDEQTLALIDALLRDSRYAYDDQIEYGGTLLWGADAAHNAFGPNSRTGAVIRKIMLGDALNVKEMKRVNYAKAARESLGRAFVEDLERVAPGHLAKLRAHYGGIDDGRMAVRFLTEKGFVGDTPVDVLKPSYLGARTPVNLDKVAQHFDGVANADELRAAVRAGEWDETGFRDVLIEAGADPDFVSRAFVTAAAEFTPDEWWDAYRINFKGGNARATKADRALMRAVAEVHNMTEAEYLAKYMADVPHSVDEGALMMLADADKRWFQLMEEVVDGAVHGRTQAVDDAIEKFRLDNAHVADREHFAMIDDDGTVVASGSQFRAWTTRPDGIVVEAALGDEITPFMSMARNRTVIHNHPSHNPMSPADISSAVEWETKEMLVSSPGITYSLRPASVEDGGWWTDEFSTMFEGQDWPEIRAQLDAIWHAESRKVIDELRALPFYARRQGDYYDHYLDAVATNTAVQRIADRFGWHFDSVTDFRLPVDPVQRHELLARMAEQSIPHLKAQYPFAYRSEPLEAVNMAGLGTDISVEVTSPTRAWEPRNLSEDVQRAVMDGMEDWSRSEVAPLVGVGVARVTRARGGWMEGGVFSDAVNTVQDVFGTAEQAFDYAAAQGYLYRQNAVVTSKIKPGKVVADADSGERWALQFTTTRELSAEEAEALTRQIAAVAPDVAEWGSSVTVDALGRTSIRFVDYTGEGMIQQADFLAKFDGEGIAAKLEDVEVRPAVVDYRYIENDWSVNPNGEGYLDAISARRPDLARKLAGGLRREADDRLAALYRQHAPEEFDAAVAAARERGEHVPDFRVPGEYEPRPEGVILSIPGGRESLLDPNRTFTLWEQQVLKAQTINASALYNADPDLYADLMAAIWRGKWKELDTPEQVYNAFLFANMTASAPLDVTEGAFALLRVNRERGIGMARMVTRANRIIDSLPERFRRNPAHIGTRFQLDEGLLVSGYDLNRATWLTPEQRSTIDRFQSRLDEAMRNTPEEQREALARAVQRRLDGRRAKGRAGARRRVAPDIDTSFVDDVVDIVGINKIKGVTVQVHPYPTKTVFTPGVSGGPTTGLSTFISVARPGVQFKGIGTNTQWGRALRWLNDGIFDSNNPAVQRFVTRQAGESREAYALRMSSILPGIDVKTGMMAMQSAGPRALAHGALDTHIVRYIVQKALKRGDLERAAPLLDEIAPVPGSQPVPPGMVRAYHYTRDIDAVQEQGLDVAFAKGETYGEPNAIWFSTAKPDEDATNFVEVFIRADEIDTIGTYSQADLDAMMAKGSNFMVRTEKITPDRFVTVSRPRQQRLRYIAETYVPGTPEAQAWLDDPMGAAFAADLDDDYAWAVEQWTLMHRGGDGLLSRLTPQYAAHLREEIGRITDNASTAFRSPEADPVYLVPDGKFRGQPWSPEKERVMRSRLHLIEDPEVRALYEDSEVLRLVSETGGKVNRWGGDYAVLDDYFNTVLKQEEVDALRAAGHTRAADAVERMSGGEFQWFKWDQIRSASGRSTPLDPHVGISNGADLIPPRVGAELDRSIGLSRMGTPFDPKERLFQQIDGKTLGANQIMPDSRRILLATQNVDGRTGLHELAHVLEQHLDPSMRDTVIAEFRKATGSRRTTWSREVGEWWADSLLAYARSGHRPGNAALRPSFDYFRRTLNGIEATIKAQQEATVLARTKASAVRKATKQVERHTPAARQAEREVRAAQRAQQTANRELRRARAKASLDVLEGRAQVLKDEVVLLDEMLKDAKANVRVARSAARAADMRAQQAVGTASAGGLRASAKRAAKRVDDAVAETQRLTDELARARAASAKASRKAAGARRRSPIHEIERARDRARAATEKAMAKQRAADKALKQARRELDEAKALSTKPARAKVAPIPLSEEMRKVWDDITTPPPTTPTTVGTGEPYDLQQEAVYQAARHSLSRAEEDAFRLHYYKRGRSFVERSINHPYFGLYPASYMWGKILPEMVRFLIKTPFGLDAPLGGLALSHNVYRGVMVQQQYDPEFRAKMAEQTDLWHFVAMLTPSLPWEIPVNAPLWMRRFSEANLTRDDKLASLTPEQRAMLTPEQMAEDYPTQTIESMGRTGREMFNYAFGPAAAIEQATALLGGGAGLVQDTVQTTVDEILRAGQGVPAPVQAEQPSLFGVPQAMMPAQGLGSTEP